MKKIVLFIALISLFWLNYAHSQEQELIFTYINNKNVCGYSKLKGNFQCQRLLPWGARIVFKDGNSKKSKGIWFKRDKYPLRLSDGKKIMPWWIKKTDLTNSKTLEKLEKNWPIKSLSLASGDFGSNIIFNKNGVAYMSDSDGKSIGHVFIGKGVVAIKYPKPTYENLSFVAGYNSDTKEIYVPIVPEGEHCKVGYFNDIKITFKLKNIHDCSRVN